MGKGRYADRMRKVWYCGYTRDCWIDCGLLWSALNSLQLSTVQALVNEPTVHLKHYYAVSSSLTPHRESWIRESFACYFYKIHTRPLYAEDRNCIRIQVPFHIMQCSHDVTVIVPFSSAIYSHSFHNSLRNIKGQNFPKKLWSLEKIESQYLQQWFHSRY